MSVAQSDLANQVEDENYLRECVANTQFTVEWILSALNENDEKWKTMKNMQRKVHEIIFEDISAGKGFISRVIKLTIHFSDNAENYLVPSTAALQKGLTDATDQAQEGKENEEKDVIDLNTNQDFIKVFEQIHERECLFYSKFPKVKNLPVPKVFKTEPWRIAENKEGAILMECLTEVAITGEIFIGLNHRQMEKIFDAITHFQAHVIAKTERSFIDSAKISVLSDDKMLDVFIAILDKCVQDKPRCKELYEQMHKLFYDKDLWAHTMLAHEKLGVTSVLAHGDLWTNNIMWKKNTNGTPSDELCAIIDWQVLHAGTPADDFARVLVNCCDGEYRRKYEYKLLDRYYENLCTLLEEHKLKPPFTMEEVIRSYRLQVIYQTIGLMCLIPMFAGQMQNQTDSEETKKTKIDGVWKRAELALEDSLSYCKEYFPEMI